MLFEICSSQGAGINVMYSMIRSGAFIFHRLLISISWTVCLEFVITRNVLKSWRKVFLLLKLLCAFPGKSSCGICYRIVFSHSLIAYLFKLSMSSRKVCENRQRFRCTWSHSDSDTFRNHKLLDKSPRRNEMRKSFPN